MADDLNHYEVCGVERNATTAQIRVAYKKQSMALHPDKNPYGNHLMKRLNAAWAILSDESERRKYDRELSVGGGRNNNRYYDDEYYEEQISLLERQLRNSKSTNQQLERQLRRSNSQNQELRDTLNCKDKALAASRASSKTLGKKLKQLEGKHKQAEAQCKKLNESVRYYKSENDGLQKSLNKAHDENGDLLDLHEEEKTKAAKTLKEEKQKFEDTLAAEKEKATEQMEQMKKQMLARSICYTCNGEGGNDCITCKGQGSIQGNWTRCHNCRATGSFASLLGEGKAVECLACFGKGAKEGVFHITCFKCKGDREKRIHCDTCHKGRIRGFSLKACPFCKEGRGCMNCNGRGYVSCGYLCHGNSVPPSPSSLLIALRKEDKDDAWLERFMESANSDYKHYTNEWDECRAFVSPTDNAANEDLKPHADADEANASFATFNIDTSQVSFQMGLSKGGIGGNNNRKGKKKERLSGQRKSSASSPTSVLFSSVVKSD